MDDSAEVLRPTVARALRQFFPLLAVAVLAASALGAAHALHQPARATATAALVVVDPESDLLFGARDQSPTYVADQAAVIGLDVTLRRATDLMQRNTGRVTSPRVMARALVVSNPEATNVIKLEYTDATPELAVAGIQAVTTAYRQLLGEQVAERVRSAGDSLDRAIADIDQQLRDPGATEDDRTSLLAARKDLLSRRTDVLLPEDRSNLGIRWYSPPAAPPAGKRSVARTALLLGLLALVPASAACYGLALRRRRCLSAAEAASVLGLPLLAEIPSGARGLVPTAPSVERVRPFALVLAAAAAASDPPPRSIALVPISTQGNASLSIANIALTAASGGSTILALDAHPSSSGCSVELLPAGDAAAGLRTVLAAGAPVQEAISESPLSGALDVLTATTPTGAATPLNKEHWRQVLKALREDYELVLVDVPAPTRAPENQLVLSAVDLVLLLVPHKALARDMDDEIQWLRLLDIRPVAFVYDRSRPTRRWRAPLTAAHVKHVSQNSEPATSTATMAKPPGEGGRWAAPVAAGSRDGRA